MLKQVHHDEGFLAPQALLALRTGAQHSDEARGGHKGEREGDGPRTFRLSTHIVAFQAGSPVLG
jgi:hypothetical protein